MNSVFRAPPLTFSDFVKVQAALTEFSSLYKNVFIQYRYSELGKIDRMTTIINLLERIKNGEIVLPAIQRDFVWSESKIEKLLDSVMRGYPIGIVFLWETYNDIQYRDFALNYLSDSRYIFHDNEKQKRLNLVLDGQQRLQSLYVALYGTYEGKDCYFDVLSGQETEDFREDKYVFNFLTAEQAKQKNELSSSQEKEVRENENYEPYYYKTKDLLTMGAREMQQLQIELGKKLIGEDQLRLNLNFNLLHNTFAFDPHIITATVLDENKPKDSPDRKSESDVLEAFVRINREGTPLTRSDLIFSMLKLTWKESARTLPDFVDNINKGNSFDLDSDFVIRCLFAVSDLGTKFDVDLLRKKSNVQTIRENFDKCCDAISSTIDFVQNDCWISSSRLLGGYYNLVPIVYYLFNMKDHQIPTNEVENVRKAVYIFGFTSPFSRYADSRLGGIIRRVLKPAVERKDEKFPLKIAISWVKYWANITDYGPQLLQYNPLLTLHLVQRRSGAKVHYDKNTPQIDHIFPASVLRSMKFDEPTINNFANFWILAKNKNQNDKRDKDPATYFTNVDDSILLEAYIDKKLLNYDSYTTFLAKREQTILNHVKKELKITDADFKT